MEEVSARLASNTDVIDPKSNLYKDLTKFKLAGRFKLADELFQMSKFDDAIRRYSALALRYQGQVLELGALSQVFYCYALTRQPEKAQAVATRMRAAYDKMPDSMFTGASQEFQRSFWVDWFAKAPKQLAAP